MCLSLAMGQDGCTFGTAADRASGMGRIEQETLFLQCPAEHVLREHRQGRAVMRLAQPERFGGMSLRLESARRLASPTGFEPVFQP